MLLKNAMSFFGQSEAMGGSILQNPDKTVMLLVLPVVAAIKLQHKLCFLSYLFPNIFFSSNEVIQEFKGVSLNHHDAPPLWLGAPQEL